MASLVERLKAQGWVEIWCRVHVHNMVTGEKKWHDNDRRLISSSGNATYRPNTGVLTRYSAYEEVTID